MLQKTSADFYDILNRYLTCVMNADKLLEIVMTNEKDQFIDHIISVKTAEETFSDISFTFEDTIQVIL